MKKGEPTLSIYRYTVTRLCLLEGSLRLQKNLQGLFGALEGEISLRDERGIEFSARISQKEAKLWGLTEYYGRIGLGVNDVLSLSRLEERKFQLEAVVKHARVSTQLHTPLPRPATPQRVVLGESEFLREVRVERPRSGLTATTPYSSNTSSSSTSNPNKAAEYTSARASESSGSSASESSSATYSNGRIDEVRESTKPEVLSVDVGGRRYVPILPQQAAPQPTASQQTLAQNTPIIYPASTGYIAGSERTDKPAVSPSSGYIPPISRTPGSSTPSSAPDFGLLERFAKVLGYTVNSSGSLVFLEAKLGRQSYRVALAYGLQGAPDWEALERTEADFRAVLVREDSALEHPKNFKVTRVTVEALETLLESAALSPLTPLELRGYWNATAIDQNSAHSLAEIAGRELGSRGIFSQVLLCLTEFEPHSSIRISHLIHRLGERVSRNDLETTLDTLTRPPFLAVSRVGTDEYYLRQSVQDTLTLMGDYALGLGARVRVSKTPTHLNGVKRDLLEV